MPLLVETLLLVLLAYLIGIGIGFLLFGRRRRTSFLGDD
jgi:UDP-N-acetylmuramyl pentapeptide phosphotransferase/UDP-N-acetylglucosamine-1-phosphate transferase